MRQLIFLIFLQLCYRKSYGEINTITLNGSCFWDLKYPNEDRWYYLVWDGDFMEFSKCSILFKGADSDILDDFKVCVEAVSFNISCSDPDVKVAYGEGIETVQKEIYGCGDFPPTKWCSESDVWVNITLFNASSRDLSGDSNFQLKITGEITWNDSLFFGLCFAVPFGAYVLVVIVRNVAGYFRKHINVIKVKQGSVNADLKKDIKGHKETDSIKQKPYLLAGFDHNIYPGIGQYNKKYWSINHVDPEPVMKQLYSKLKSDVP